MVVDDDPVNNTMCRYLIALAAPGSSMLDFTLPAAALEHIAATPPQGPVLLLLDINMPVLSGWDFLEAFEKIEEAHRSYSPSTSFPPPYMRETMSVPRRIRT